MDITLKDLHINYSVTGEGRNIVLLHGWGADITLYAGMIKALSAYSKVYALDMPGVGKSDEPPCAWSVDDYTDLVTDFIKAMGIKKADLIGHSFGGRVITKLMNRPQLPCEVDKIVFIDTAGMEAYEASGYEIMNYSIYRNNGTSIGEALVSDYDGGFSLCDNGDILFFRNTKLMKYSASEKKESEVCDTQLKRHRLSVRFITDEYAYIVGYRDEKDDEGYYTQKGYMYKLNLKTGDKELIKGVPERVLFEY